MGGGSLGVNSDLACNRDPHHNTDTPVLSYRRGRKEIHHNYDVTLFRIGVTKDSGPPDFCAAPPASPGTFAGRPIFRTIILDK